MPNLPPPRYLAHIDVLYYRCPSCRVEFSRVAPQAQCGTCYGARVPIDLTRTLEGVTIKPDDRKEDPMTEQTVKKLLEAAITTGFLEAVLKILASEPDVLALVTRYLTEALKKG